MKLKSILLCATATLLVSNSFGQYNVSTYGKKYTLVEEATGPGCGYCPDGAQDIEETIATNYPHAVIASWHGSSYDGTDMVVTGDPYCAGTGYISGFPMGSVDRYPVLGGAVGKSRPWDSYVSNRDALTPNFDVTMHCLYDPATKVITITIIGKALSAQTGTWNVNALITEDSISSAAAAFQQHSYLNSSTTACNGQPCWFTGLGSVLPAAKYSHMNVVRASLGANIFGDLAFTNPAAGATFTKTYSYTIPAISNPTYVKVIGMFQKPGPANSSAGNAIENVIQSRVRLMPKNAPLSVNEVSKAMAEVTLFPNPAKNRITVKGVLSAPSDTKIEICNSIGQVVLAKEYPSGGSLFGEVIEMNNFANGEYFMNIYNGGEKVTKSFTVSK